MSSRGQGHGAAGEGLLDSGAGGAPQQARTVGLDFAEAPVAAAGSRAWVGGGRRPGTSE